MCEKKTELTGNVITVEDPTYEADRQNLIKLYQTYPYAIVFVQNTQDVKNALKWSRENNVSVRPRCGRCSTEGWSGVNNGITIDVSNLKQIQIDYKKRMVKFGAGFLQGELVNALTNTGLYTSTGNEGILGLSGVLLGGGAIGMLSRKLGPGCDSVLEVEIVVPSGKCGAKLVTANKHENADLFWACRGGGGGNFGVVTSFVMQLYKAPKLVVVWESTFPLSSLFDAFNTFQHWAPFADPRLGATCTVFNNRILIKGIFLGSLEEAGNILDPIKNLPTGNFTETEESFSNFYKYSGQTELPFQKYSPLFIPKPLPAEAIAIIGQFMIQAPSPESNFYTLAWGGNTRCEPSGGTAFPKRNRKSIMYCEPGAEWSDPTINAKSLNWVEEFRLALSPFFDGAGYVNVLDGSIQQYGEAYYGTENFIKLQNVKKRWDPTNTFNFQQGIPVLTAECDNNKKN